MVERVRRPHPLRMAWPGLVEIGRSLPLAGRWAAALVWVWIVLGGLLPVLMSAVTAGAVAAAADGDGDSLQRWLWLFVGLFAVSSIVGTWSDTVRRRANRHLDGRLRERMIDASTLPVGVRHLEDVEVLKAFQGARDSTVVATRGAGRAAELFSSVLVPRIRVLGYVVGLLIVWWPLGIAMGVLSVVNDYFMPFAAMRSMGGGRAMMNLAYPNYQRDVATTAAAAKEVRVFGLGPWLSERYVTGVGAARAAAANTPSGRRDLSSSDVWLLVVNGVVTAAGILLLASRVNDGAVGFAAFVFAMGAMNGLRPQPNVADVSVPILTGLFFQVAAAEGVARAADDVPGARSADGMPAGSIRFEGVGFRYPGTERDVLCDLDLELRAGERTALVGVNGAGKTTIVKLLSRLYEPTVGSITIDGVALSEVSPEAWRGQVAVLFQDFVHYELPARDNIAFGAVHLAADDEVVLEDAQRAGVGSVVAGLSSGLATPLSPRFTGGTDLSGGEWQRIALARALHAMRGGARLLVLDEPTANLDVRAEAELYDRFLGLTGSSVDGDYALTTLLVSHRFSTVRQADRIVVLEGGRVIEDGSHDDLVALGGQYAAMFRAQADRFTGDDGSGGDTDDASESGVVG